MEKKQKEILFIAQYPENVSPGQRFRFELYKEVLKKNNFNITTRSFLDKNGYDVIHLQGNFFPKAWAVFKGYINRFILLFKITKFDYIFLQREAAPLGPPIFEWLYIKVFKRKLIFDFDDAIWMPHISENNSLFLRLKSVSKIQKICNWAYKVSGGNEYLCQFARRFSNNVVYNPTCVDVENKHNILASHDVERVTVGWTGSFSTLKYLDMLEPVLQKLQERYDFNIKIICNQQPGLQLNNLQYIPWTPENEVKELSTFQIGLMPLTDDEWSKGKCGFKLIQYLSLGIPAVSAPVGVNKLINENGVTGFLCETQEEWYIAIEQLINNKELRKKMGAEGRKKIIEKYSLQSNTENFLSMFQ